jgi:hypothetical protein
MFINETIMSIRLDWSNLINAQGMYTNVNLSEYVMNHSDLLTKVIVPIVSALFSGLVVFFLIPDWQTTARQNEWIPKSEWMAEVKEKGWILKDSCPAYPLKISIMGPGENSVIPIDGNSRKTIQPDVIVKFSRNLKEGQGHIGVVFKYDDDDHYRVTFPSSTYEMYGNYYRFNEQGNILRLTDLYLPKYKNPTTLRMWVFVVDDKAAIGSMYLTIEEVVSLPYVLTYSNEASYRISAKG